MTNPCRHHSTWCRLPMAICAMGRRRPDTVIKTAVIGPCRQKGGNVPTGSQRSCNQTLKTGVRGCNLHPVINYTCPSTRRAVRGVPTPAALLLSFSPPPWRRYIAAALIGPARPPCRRQPARARAGRTACLVIGSCAGRGSRGWVPHLPGPFCAAERFNGLCRGTLPW